jgi:hypothetical protein
VLGERSKLFSLIFGRSPEVKSLARDSQRTIPVDKTKEEVGVGVVQDGRKGR